MVFGSRYHFFFWNNRKKGVCYILLIHTYAHVYFNYYIVLTRMYVRACAKILSFFKKKRKRNWKFCMDKHITCVCMRMYDGSNGSRMYVWMFYKMDAGYVLVFVIHLPLTNNSSKLPTTRPFRILRKLSQIFKGLFPRDSYF